VPWKVRGTWYGKLTTATGSPAISLASRITRLERCSAAWYSRYNRNPSSSSSSLEGLAIDAYPVIKRALNYRFLI